MKIKYFGWHTLVCVCVQRAIVYARSLTLTRLRGRRATNVIIRATTLEQESSGAYSITPLLLSFEVRF